MTLVKGPVAVRTPASAANLGPGYDALGLALAMHDRLEAEVLADGLEVDVTGEGADDVPRDRDHLVVRAMDAAFDLLGERPPGLRLTCDNVIPHARGLGSSSAAIVGGIVLARALVEGGDERLNDAGAYQLASDLEGHPDNVAAAMFGGFTIAWLDGTVASVQRLDVAARVTVLVPPEPVSTMTARNLLPSQVPHGDAAANGARAALLVAALTSDPTHLLAATEDFLHQSYRAEAMPASHELVQGLRSAGVPAVISGAGPTVLAFGRGLEGVVPTGWAAHELDVEPRGAHVDTGVGAGPTAADGIVE
ncbi:homoserine kinase [Aeromicrobium sp.]|uniref:homoserine kinase n=1 Tax=Aeromicrobium sp. TaxID=1871063 RepID=UPI003D6AE61C